VRGPNLRPPWALLPLAFAALAAQAAGGDAPQHCAGIDHDRSRLECYDAIFRKPAESAASAAVPGAAAETASASVSASVSASAAANPESDFGLTEAAKRARDPQQEMLESITGKVAAVSRRPAGELIVTLENGQVWTQVTVDQRKGGRRRQGDHQEGRARIAPARDPGSLRDQGPSREVTRPGAVGSADMLFAVATWPPPGGDIGCRI
jgi:hypothetical protein